MTSKYIHLTQRSNGPLNLVIDHLISKSTFTACSCLLQIIQCMHNRIPIKHIILYVHVHIEVYTCSMIWRVWISDTEHVTRYGTCNVQTELKYAACVHVTCMLHNVLHYYTYVCTYMHAQGSHMQVCSLHTYNRTMYGGSSGIN